MKREDTKLAFVELTEAQAATPRVYTPKTAGELISDPPPSRATMWRLQKKHGFPRPRKITGRNVYLADEVDQWIARRLGLAAAA